MRPRRRCWPRGEMQIGVLCGQQFASRPGADGEWVLSWVEQSRGGCDDDLSRPPSNRWLVVRLTRRNTFGDRREAGRMLASRLLEMDLADPVVIALPRGGVPVGFEVASALRAPLDIGLVRKLGHPNQPELGLGAIGEDGTVVVDERATGGVRHHPRADRADRRPRIGRARPPAPPLPRRHPAGRDPRPDRDRRRRRHRHRRHRVRCLPRPQGAGRRAGDPRRAGLPGRDGGSDRR